jgi:hypothetical protein
LIEILFLLNLLVRSDPFCKMANISERIPLQIINNQLILFATFSCSSLRVHHAFMKFVIDTGSPESFISDNDVSKLQIAMKDRENAGLIDFGGSRFKRAILPEAKIDILLEDKTENLSIQLSHSFYALKTTKSNEKKKQTAQALPSILGLNFLKEHNLSLHVIMTENLAYLQRE